MNELKPLEIRCRLKGVFLASERFFGFQPGVVRGGTASQKRPEPWRRKRSQLRWLPVLVGAFWGGMGFVTSGGMRADESDAFFGLTRLWDIELTIRAEDWRAMDPAAVRVTEPRIGPAEGRERRPGPEEGGEGGRGRPMRGPIEKNFPWRTAKFEAAGMVWTNVAIRFKGNSSYNISRGAWKRPFRLDFDREQPGRTFFGMEELVLNNNVNDGTQMREALAYECFRRAGHPAPRTAYGRVFLTVPGELDRHCLGLYTLIEPVTRDFAERHLGGKKGLLAKPGRVRGLEYFGEDWNSYASRYGIETAAGKLDQKRLIEVSRRAAADGPVDEEWAARLSDVLEVDGYLRFLALNTVLANLDSFLENGHNYYVWVPREPGKTVFLPWDLNEAFGRHPPAGPARDQSELSILRPSGLGNPMMERMLEYKPWREKYLAECGRLLREVMEVGRLTALAAEIQKVTEPVIRQESERAWRDFRRLMGAETVEDNRNGGGGEPGRGRLGMERGGREEIPLMEWVRLRRNSVEAQLAGESAGWTPQRRGRMGPGPGGERVRRGEEGERPKER